MPPALPAPGVPARASASIPGSGLQALTRPSSPRSSSETWAVSAPFCGPKTCAAPCSPRSGLVTSLAPMIAVPPKSKTPPRSTWTMRSSDPPSGSTGFPRASRNSAPRAASIPVPPSVLALPPMATTIRCGLSCAAARIASPSPRLEADNGRSAPRRVPRPHVPATSTTAVVPSNAICAPVISPSAPVTSTVRGREPAKTAASTLPSPPSASGRTVTSRRVPLAADSTPERMAPATPIAFRQPLNLSGAIRMRTGRAASGRASVMESSVPWVLLADCSMLVVSGVVGGWHFGCRALDCLTSTHCQEQIV